MSDLGSFSDFRDSESSGDEGGEEQSGGSGPEGREFDRPDVTASGSDTGVGALAVSEGLRVAEEAEENRLRAYVTAQNRTDIRLGTYLLAPYPDDETLFCRITGLEYAQAYRSDDATEIHARRAMRSSGIDEQDYKLMADLDPLAVLYPDGDTLRRRAPDRVPKPETVVKHASDHEKIRTGLDLPESGAFLGHLSVGGERVRTQATPPTVAYRLEDGDSGADPLIFRHVLIAGGTGSGKTHTAKNVLRQYLTEDRRYAIEPGSNRTPRAAVVQFDPQDEYAQMHDDNPDLDAATEREYDRQSVASGGHDDTVAFVPQVGTARYAAGHHRAEQQAFTIPFSMVRANKWLVAGGRLNDNQYNALSYLLDRFFDERSGEATYQAFLDFLDDPALRQELDESGRVHEATFDAVKRRVSAVPRGVFDQDARPITDLVHEFVRPGRLSVVPTYHLSSTRAAEMVVLALSSLLVDQKLSSDPTFERIKETPLILGMDEAHNFLADADSVQARQVIGKFTEAAKQGRKERLGLFLITQDPQDIADPVFKQLNTRIALTLSDEDAVSSLNLPTALESRITDMERGNMAVYSPDNSKPVEVMGLSTCLTRHGRD
ncbi:ATP-binding protein [Halodesulfurarchaeum formicicum]|uniref:ATPase AAA n=1 Tax=Halodesulfurarchaeum formicicum TaxID=1873524 RepID=A0A1J1AF94_9EURY|nr:ATP-binding protein [Halodesulfurarchaeum formicicum]APE96483.1 ATPase AAA [Halodesulfurarchaeum formicicum]